jgi:hypothetical protein
MDTDTLLEHPKLKAAAEQIARTLEHLEVVVPAPEPVTERDVLARLDELRYPHAATQVGES